MLFTEVKLANAISFGPYKKGFKLEIPLTFQTPRMRIPFGLSKFTSDGGDVKWTMDFSLEGHPKFAEFLREIDAIVIKHVHAHSQEIFNRQLTIEDVRKSYLSNVKQSSNPEKYAPNFRVKVDTTHFYDANGSLLLEDEEKEDKGYRGLDGVAIFELSSIYFFNMKIGCTWKAEQVKLFEKSNKKQKTDDDENIVPEETPTAFAFRAPES